MSIKCGKKNKKIKKIRMRYFFSSFCFLVFLHVCISVCMYACMYACISYTRLPTCWSSMKEKRNYTNREKKNYTNREKKSSSDMCLRTCRCSVQGKRKNNERKMFFTSHASADMLESGMCVTVKEKRKNTERTCFLPHTRLRTC